MNGSINGTIVDVLKPFSFRVRLEDGRVIVCGLERSYFGRMTPQEAIRRLEKDGPHVGDIVLIRLAADSELAGVILRERSDFN